MRRLSRKKTKERRGTIKLFEKHLLEHPKCIIEGCNEEATVVHHPFGRGVVHVDGKKIDLYLNSTTFAGSCDKHHDAVEFREVEKTSFKMFDKLIERPGFIKIANATQDKIWFKYKNMMDDLEEFIETGIKEAKEWNNGLTSKD